MKNTRSNGRIISIYSVMLIASIVIFSAIIASVIFLISYFSPREPAVGIIPTYTAVTSTKTDATEGEATEDAPPSNAPPNNAPPVVYPHDGNAVYELGDEISSKYALLVDADTMTVIAAKNAGSVIYPASMTKIMTAIVAYEHINDLDDTFVITADILDPLEEANASVAGFKENEAVTMRDLIYGALLPSGAECTIALAEYVAGSEAEFVKLMNEKSDELGLKNTKFMNTSGLHDDLHYSTPADIAVIMKYAMDIPPLREALGADRHLTAKTVEHPDGIMLESTTFARMAFDHSAGKALIKAGKTGYTDEARHCLVTYAVDSSGEHGYILVLADTSTMYLPGIDAKYVYEKFAGGS